MLYTQTFTRILTKEALLFAWYSIWWYMMHDHSKYGHKRFCGSESTRLTSIHQRFEAFVVIFYYDDTHRQRQELSHDTPIGWCCINTPVFPTRNPTVYKAQYLQTFPENVYPCHDHKLCLILYFIMMPSHTKIDCKSFNSSTLRKLINLTHNTEKDKTNTCWGGFHAKFVTYIRDVSKCNLLSSPFSHCTCTHIHINACMHLHSHTHTHTHKHTQTDQHKAETVSHQCGMEACSACWSGHHISAVLSSSANPTSWSKMKSQHTQVNLSTRSFFVWT